MKPEVKERFVYIFRDFEMKDSVQLYGQKGRYLYGVCDPRNTPPLITFFPNVMALYKLPEEEVRKVVNHEILHTFNISHEQIEEKEASAKFT